MQPTFTLHEDFTLKEDAWVSAGSAFASGQVTAYRVGGLPNGKTARIANFRAPAGNDWRIMQIDDRNAQSGWTGHYKSVEDALFALTQLCQ